MIYGKKSVTRPPLHIALCYNSRWNGPISNFFSFWATERLFISKWGRISPESDWCWFKLVLGSSSLLLRGYMDLSPAVGHVRECPHSGTRYFLRWLLFYQKERCYGSEILNVCMSNQKKMIYGKKSVTRPPLHIALCYNSRWNGPISNFFSFWATERLFISKWGRISPESDWCWFKLVLGSSSLLLRGYMDLSPAVGHVRECPHSGTRYLV